MLLLPPSTWGTMWLPRETLSTRALRPRTRSQQRELASCGEASTARLLLTWRALAEWKAARRRVIYGGCSH